MQFVHVKVFWWSVHSLFRGRLCNEVPSNHDLQPVIHYRVISGGGGVRLRMWGWCIQTLCPLLRVDRWPQRKYGYTRIHMRNLNTSEDELTYKGRKLTDHFSSR